MKLDPNTSAHKAHVGSLVSGIATFIALGLFFFGRGDMPTPEEIALAIVTIGGTAASVWTTVYQTRNRSKHPPYDYADDRRTPDPEPPRGPQD